MRRLSLGLIILILLQFAFGGQRSPQGNGNVTFWEDEDKEKNKPRTLSDIKSVISKLLATVQKGEEPAYEKIPSNTGKIIAGKMRKASLEAALAQLKIYRYLAGLPYKDIELNGEFSNGAQHAVVLMSILGRISHNPSKPADVPDDFFKIAFKGAASSNLAGGGESNLTTAINNWMSDSDKTNIDRLGHRRWLLNPSMKDVGFGFYNGFAAGWVVGGSRDSSPDYDFIAFPVPGFHPWTYFGTKWAWSVSINPKKYQPDQFRHQFSRLSPMIHFPVSFWQFLLVVF